MIFIIVIVVSDDLNTSIIFAVYVYIVSGGSGGVDSISFRRKILMVE